MNNQECKVRPEIKNINSNEPISFPYSIKTSKCSSSCNKKVVYNKDVSGTQTLNY